MSCLLLWQIQTLRDATFWAGHSDEVLAQTNFVERLMVEAESGFRGFLLEHDRSFLESFDHSHEVMPRAYELLATMVSDNAQQLAVVEHLKRLSGEWFDGAREVLPSNSARDSRLPEVRRGMDNIRQQFDVMVDNEERLRQQRNLRVDQTVGWVFVTSVSLLLIFATFVGLRTRKTLVVLSQSYGQVISGAQDAVKLRDEFLSIASHELKTPLTSIMLQLQLGRRAVTEAGGNPLPVGRITRTFDLCLHQMKRLVTLVDDLLDVSRIQSGRLGYQFEYVNLSELVKEAGERLVDQFVAEGCQLSLNIESGVIAWCDRFRIDQVIANLLSNALKYGEGKPVNLNLQRDNNEAVISVVDHGNGIAADKQHLIFELYERAVGSANISGLGLGLYISKQIVSAHEGVIVVDSEKGLGAKFHVRLPLEPRDKQGEQT